MLLIAKVNYIVEKEGRAALLPEHRAYMMQFYQQGKILVSGPFEPADGGLLIFNVDSKAELESIIDGDPFKQNHFYTLEVFEWRLTLGAADIEALIANRSSSED